MRVYICARFPVFSFKHFYRPEGVHVIIPAFINKYGKLQLAAVNCEFVESLQKQYKPS